MNNKNLYYGLGILLFVVAGTMSFLHMKADYYVFIGAFIVLQLTLSAHARQLEERIEKQARPDFRLAFGLVAVGVIGAALLQVLHVPGAVLMLLGAMVTGMLVQATYITRLEKRVSAES